MHEVIISVSKQNLRDYLEISFSKLTFLIFRTTFMRQ